MGKEIIGGGSVEGLPLSEAVRAGGFVFLSGLVAFGPDDKVVPGGIEAETRVVLDEAERLLTLAGATLDDVVKVNVYLTRPEDFDGFNRMYRVRFPRRPPARISMCVQLTIDARLELDMIAYIGDRQ